MILRANNRLLALVPLIPPLLILIPLLDNPIPTVIGWMSLSARNNVPAHQEEQQLQNANVLGGPGTGSQLWAYLIMAFFGNFATKKLIPNIKMYTLRKGICGKDLGKRGTSTADKEM